MDDLKSNEIATEDETLRLQYSTLKLLNSGLFNNHC